MEPKKHPSRSDLIGAARQKSERFDAHLKRCSGCRVAFEMYAEMDPTETGPLQKPSATALARRRAIPLLHSGKQLLRRILGRATADSWTQIPALALRDSSAGLERRLVLEADAVRLELVAERTPTEWEFVARVYEDNTVAEDYLLKAGARKVIPQAAGFYYWKAKRPPRTIRLLGQRLQLDFEKLSWTSAMTN